MSICYTSTICHGLYRIYCVPSLTESSKQPFKLGINIPTDKKIETQQN